MDASRDRFWQDRWRSAGLATARRDPAKEKFYALEAYPGTSGFLHLGHLRGPVLADVLTRYYRMRGRAVFLPTGTHASGLPAVTFAQRIAEGDPGVRTQLELNRVPPSEWPKLTDPAEAVRFLGRHYLDTFRRVGLLIDESAAVSTIDPDYQAFIRWQFRRLGREGLLRQGPRYSAVCPVCGQVSVDPSETDLASGGDAEIVAYTLVPFTLDDGRILLAATLRPETVYGATNVWLPASGTLQVWHHDERAYLVSAAGARRLSEQHGGRIGHEVPVASLTGHTVVAPLTGARLPVFPSTLVDPERGTGVVMSVPAHAPADWLGLAALSPGERSRVPVPPVIIEFPPLEELPPSERMLLAGDGPPAARALAALGVRSLAPSEPLEEVTQRVYRLEFLRGRLRRDLLDGLFVPQARDHVARTLWPHGDPGSLREFSKPVICRNGHAVEIRKVADQWFLAYGDEGWKDQARALAARITCVPAEYGKELEGILDWFDDRPCTRKGRWLGTPLPEDPEWIVEPIADSTFYPAYFVVRRFVADGRVPLSALTDAFFDRVFLGHGPGEPTLDPRVESEVAEEFRYWYPLDANIGGKEHKRVHFPVFLYTHARLLPAALQPRGIFVHWWLTEAGGAKVSKKHIGKKGGAIPPLFEALESWGADSLRLFQVLAARPEQDIEWDPELPDRFAERVAEVERLVRENSVPGGGGPPELDAWLTSRTRALVAEANAALERWDLRSFGEIAYSGAPALLRRYLARGGAPGPAVERFLSAWIRLLSPVTPHLAEELGAGRFPELVAVAPFPRAEEFEPAPEAEAAEAYLEQVETDLRDVLKASAGREGVPSGIAFFVAGTWKRTLEHWMREAAERSPGGPPPIRELIDRARGHAELAAHVGEIASYVTRAYPMLRQERGAPPELDELAVLRRSEGYLVRRFGFARVQVLGESEAAPHDPKGRRERARPGRPAFYLSGAPAAVAPGS